MHIYMNEIELVNFINPADIDHKTWDIGYIFPTIKSFTRFEEGIHISFVVILKNGLILIFYHGYNQDLQQFYIN